MNNKSIKIVAIFLTFTLCVGMFYCLNITFVSNLDVKSSNNGIDNDICIAPEATLDVTSNTTTTYSNYVNQYFRNLNNIGNNIYGTCAYIALGMFLSYFDSYWNDNIIPEQYDKTETIVSSNSYLNSPGIYDPTVRDEDVDIFDYKAYMMTQTSDNFHAYLLSIGNSLGYMTDSRLEKNKSMGVFFDETYNVLNEYLSLNPAANTENFSYTYINHMTDYDSIATGTSSTYSEIMYDNIVGWVKLGYPVIVSVAGPNRKDSGHVLIAYDYDEDTNTLYGNFGWKGYGYTHTNVLGYAGGHTYEYIKGYILGVPNSTHSHSNNYVLQNGERLCSCKLDTHNHSYKYTRIDESTHSRTCYCDDYSEHSHTFTVNSTSTKYVCMYCGHTKPYTGGVIGIPWFPGSKSPEDELQNIEIPIGNEKCYLMSA